MKTTIESDRIRLVAENDDDNQAIVAIINLYCCSGHGNNDIGNDMGCFIINNLPKNYVCIPLEDVCEKLAYKSGNLIDINTLDN